MMVKRWKIKDVQELHMRPATDLCTIALEYECRIVLRIGTREYDAKSLLSVLSACVQSGDEIEIDCEGTDEEAAMEQISAFFDGLS